jgi:predicted acetyltransferase
MMLGVGALEIVNPVPAEELPGWVRTMSTTFLGDPDSERTTDWTNALARDWCPERGWGARERGQWVATLRTMPRRLTVPGAPGHARDVEVDALTNVTVAATHRRRGLLTRMLVDSLAHARERGDALSILIAAEWPIYGRFGYAPATLSSDYVLRRSRAGAVPPGDPGRVRQVEIEEFARLAPEVFAAARGRRAGQVDRDGDWWKRTLGLDGYPRPDGLPHNWLVHEGEEGPDGLLAWKAEGNNMSLLPPYGRAELSHLTAATDGAYRDLWAYAAGIDLVDEVSVKNRPVDEPVRWLLADGRTLVVAEQVDFLWLRILDVPAALSIRRYGVDGELVLEVLDEPIADFVSGRYVLRSQGDASQCEATDRPAEVQLTQRALSSIYLGGFHAAEIALGGGVRQLVPGSVARLDLMFSTPVAPWNATWF